MNYRIYILERASKFLNVLSKLLCSTSKTFKIIPFFSETLRPPMLFISARYLYSQKSLPLTAIRKDVSPKPIATLNV